MTKSLEVEGHLHGCSGCAAALQRHAALRSSLSAASIAFVPPTSLEWRVHKALRREARRGTGLLLPWRWAAVPVAATLAAVLSWSAAIHRAGMSDESAISSELVSGHVRSLQVDHLVDVASSDWTPSLARASLIPGGGSDISVIAVGDNRTGTNYVNFLAGAKVRLSDVVILSGAVNVPVTNEGLQPIVGGTVALEVYF